MTDHTESFVRFLVDEYCVRGVKDRQVTDAEREELVQQELRVRRAVQPHAN